MTNTRNLYVVDVENINGNTGALSILRQNQSGYIDSKEDYLSTEQGEIPILIIRDSVRKAAISKLEKFRFQGKEIPRNKIYIVTLGARK